MVDDERGPRESLRMILSPHAPRVAAPEAAPRRSKLLRRQQVDLVTLDLNMPGMNGEDVMRLVHNEFPRHGDRS